jgi:hypothetical protein
MLKIESFFPKYYEFPKLTDFIQYNYVVTIVLFKMYFKFLNVVSVVLYFSFVYVVFYFTNNVGPYVIKNTLVDEAKYGNILFFDSDDVLAEGTIDRVNDILSQCEYAGLKYINFTNNINKQGHMMNDAVICIKKALFNSLNGFYDWRCGADTEFSKRLEHNNIKTKSFDGVCYYRRLCPTSLTHAKETGHGSQIRTQYVNYINKAIKLNQWPNPVKKITQEYDKDSTTS